MCKICHRIVPPTNCRLSIYSWTPISIGWRSLGITNPSIVQGCLKQLVPLIKAKRMESWDLLRGPEARCYYSVWAMPSTVWNRTHWRGRQAEMSQGELKASTTICILLDKWFTQSYYQFVIFQQTLLQKLFWGLCTKLTGNWCLGKNT